MSAEPAIYEQKGVLQRACLYLVMCGVAGGMDAAVVESHLRIAMEAVPEEVKPFLGDLLIGLALTDPTRAAAFAAEAFKRFDDAVLASAREADLLSKLPTLRDALIERATTEGRPAHARFTDARAALEASRDANDLDRARAAFDVLEDLAHRGGPEAGAFLDLVGVPRWESVVAPHEARWAAVPLLLMAARPADAGNLLIVGAWELVSPGNDASLDLARDAVDQARWLGVEPPPELVRILEPKSPPPQPARRPHGRVLFIGGNETQEQYDRYLQDQVRSRWPEVALESLYTGWSSNWGRDIASIENAIGRAGVIVLMKFVRTMLGQKVRALCSEYRRPWVACTGHGRESLVRSIERAVAMLPDRA
jgi:hypothetical protein